MFDFFRKKGNNPEVAPPKTAAPERGRRHRRAAPPATRWQSSPPAPARRHRRAAVPRVHGRSGRPDVVLGLRRYAARLLSEAEAPSLRAIAVEHPVELRRLNTTGLFWSIFDDSTISAGNRGTILRIESVLDRLALISKALGRRRGAPPM